MAEARDSNGQATVLIVDDAPENIRMIAELLSPEYRTVAATNGRMALEVGALRRPDLILLDVVMPEMDGYEVCRRFKADPLTADIPVIFLTSRADAQDEERGFDLGGVDYIAKPFSPSVVKARVRTQLQLKSVRDFLANRGHYLEQEVDRRTREITAIQNVTMVAMGSLAETRDNETGWHIRRTQHYMAALAGQMARHPRFRNYLAEVTSERLYRSAPLHDIGKVGIPDRILLKPGKLTADEFEIMKTHTTLGYRAILAAEKHIQSGHSFLRVARDIAWTHHERWDGGGYPRALAGEDIPIPGRLMAVTDVYDALISQRVYKAALPHDEAVRIIQAGAGTHFDPDVAQAFSSISDEFRAIATNFREDKEIPS